MPARALLASPLPAGTRAPADDQAGLAGRLPVRGAAAAGRVDPAGQRRRVRDLLQARARHQAGPVRGHLRRPLRDLSAERFPFQHPRAHCWVRRAGSKWKVYICTYEVPGGGPGHREQITRELAAIYQPRCNTERYGQSWKDEWIGEYTSAPNTGPLARRGPGTPSARRHPRADRAPGRISGVAIDLRPAARPRGGRLAAWGLRTIPPVTARYGQGLLATAKTCRTRPNRGARPALTGDGEFRAPPLSRSVAVIASRRSRPRRGGGTGGYRRPGGPARAAPARRARRSRR